MKTMSFAVAGLSLLAAVPSLAGDGVVALQTADPSCPGDSGNIYVDCGNGTVTDNRTGLVWMQHANCPSGAVDWHTAMEIVAGLSDPQCGLSDGSAPGEWRLPSRAEWEAMIEAADGDKGDLDCIPPITDDSGSSCWEPACPKTTCSFIELRTTLFGDFYWSSTTNLEATDMAYAMHIELSTYSLPHHVRPWFKWERGYIWPVRGGQ